MPDIPYELLFPALFVATFLFSIPVGFFGRKVYLRSGRVARKWIVLCCFSAIAIASGILFSKWSFRGMIADAVFLSLAYLSYSLLVFLISTRPKAPFVVLTVIGMVPTAAGLFLSVVGILGLMFVFGDMAPHERGNLNRNYAYRIAWWGGAMTDHDGADLKIFYRPTLAPFLEKEIYAKTYIDSSYDFDALKVFLVDGQIVLQCPSAGGKSIETERITVSR